MRKQEIILNFINGPEIEEEDKQIRDGLSGVVRTGNNLWVCCDERSSVERLTLLKDGRFGDHKSFDLNDYIPLPGGKGCEVDIEGLAIEDEKYLWLVGSHSLARKKPRKTDPPEKQIKRLAKIREDPNRYVLTRIPIVKNKKTGDFELYKSYSDRENEAGELTAAQLISGPSGNQLLELLSSDPHFKDFMKIPGKDNGFDIEGIAVKNGKIFLGVRGPVLRGWAVILELQIENISDSYFQLRSDKTSKFYRKHFLHLNGMGVRDLVVSDNDLLILAGPTMDLDGTIALYRWPGGTQNESETIVHRKELQRLFEIPHGSGETSGQDKAEGITMFDTNHILIVYDSPTAARKPLDAIVIADLFEVLE